MAYTDPEVLDMFGSAEGASAALALPSSPKLPVATGGRQYDAFVGGAYDGADRFSQELALWNPARKSADQDMLPEKGILDARVRDLARNDGLINSGFTLHKDNIVGAQYILNSKPHFKYLGLDETWAEEFQEEVETKYQMFADSPDCWVSADRKHTLTSFLRLGVGISLAAGEVLASVEWIRSTTRPFNTALNFVDLDRLCNPHGTNMDPRMRGGIEIDKYGAAVACHIRMAHPTEYRDPNSFLWKRVPIRKPWGRMQMIYLADSQRAEQTRAVSQITSILKDARIIKRFRDLNLQNMVFNATFAASIESEMPSDEVFARLGANGSNDVDPYEAYAASYLNTVNLFAGNAKNLTIDGVKVPHLLPGTKLQLRPAGQGTSLGSDFEQSCIRYIAAQLGVSYEELSRDYTNTNYSSARAAMLNTWRHMQSRKKEVADALANHHFRLWFEESVNKNELATMKGRPSIYEGQNMDAYTKAEWIGASRGQIDELKETQAAVLRINNNLTTFEEEMARQGKDWRVVLRQRQREQKMMKELGLDVVQNDKMMNALSADSRDSRTDNKAKDDPGGKTDE